MAGAFSTELNILPELTSRISHSIREQQQARTDTWVDVGLQLGRPPL